MADKLKLEVDSLEGVDETLHGLYEREGEEGPFKLAVDGLPDTKGLKTALDKERKTVKELRDAAKPFKEVDLDKYNDLLAREAQLEEASPEKIEELVSGRVRKNDEKWKSRESELLGALDTTREKLNKVMVSDELRRVGEELGVDGAPAMEDFVARGRQIFKVNKDGDVVAMNGDEAVYGESGVDPLTMTEFGKTLQEKASHLFKSSSGGGASNDGDKSARGGTVRSKADLKDASEKAAYIRKHGQRAYLELPKTA